MISLNKEHKTTGCPKSKEKVLMATTKIIPKVTIVTFEDHTAPKYFNILSKKILTETFIPPVQCLSMFFVLGILT